MFLKFYALTRLKFLEAIIAALFFPSLAEALGNVKVPEDARSEKSL
jgi:hypothetical protein